MENNRSIDPLDIPPPLLAQVQAAAEEEHRPAAEVVRDAVEHYLRNRRWQKLFAYGEQRARDLGVGEESIPHLIAEYREERSKVER